MKSTELTHTNVLNMLQRDFEIHGAADVEVDSGYYVYRVKMIVETAVASNVEFNASLWLKFAPNDRNQITALRFRKGFAEAKFTKRKNKGGMCRYKPAHARIKSLSFDRTDAHFLLLEMPLVEPRVLRDLHKFYIEC